MALPVYSFEDGDYWANNILNDLEAALQLGFTGI
jgi:hypothetical protein